MFDASMIFNCITREIKRNKFDFIIVPYGENGFMVKSVLKEAFNLHPIAIGDNGCAGTDGIILVDSLKDVYKRGMKVILTAENKQVSGAIKEELSRFTQPEDIIDLLQYRNSVHTAFREKMKENLSLKRILPKYERFLDSHNKAGIRIRVVNSKPQTWNTISSFCEAVRDDSETELLVIIGGETEDKEECIEQVRRCGFRYVWWEEYNASKDCPDVLVVSQPFDLTTQLPEAVERTKLVVVINTLLIRNAETLQLFYSTQRKGFDRFLPDYFICDSLLYEDIKDSYDMKPTLVEMGNPKYDGIYEACQKGHLPDGWKKLDGKKIILWTTDHGIEFDNAQHTTFDLYAETLIKEVDRQKDLALIIRLHHDLIKELMIEGFWEEEDLEDFRKYCAVHDRIVFDETENYTSAFSNADVIITDAACGITVSALPTGKPICVLYRSHYDVPFHRELTDNYVQVHDKEELITFIDQTRKGKDQTAERRKKASDRFVKNFDGKNGFRIKEFIKEKFKDKIAEMNLGAQ